MTIVGDGVFEAQGCTSGRPDRMLQGMDVECGRFRGSVLVGPIKCSSSFDRYWPYRHGTGFFSFHTMSLLDDLVAMVG
jgi:hypothetical protein